MSSTSDLLNRPGASMDDFSVEEECELCHEVFPDARRLFTHYFNDHEFSKEKIEEVKIRRKNKLLSKRAANRPVFVCEFCHRPFLSKLGCTSHKEKQHNQVRVVSSNGDQILCPLSDCGARFQTYFDLATHADDVHRSMDNPDAYKIHRVRFPNFDLFVEWRAKLEQDTGSRFYTRSTETKIRYAKKVWLMKCYHTQKRRYSRNVPLSSDPLHCPAFIRVCERFNGEVEAVACFGHLGHAVQHRANYARQQQQEQVRMPQLEEQYGEVVHEEVEVEEQPEEKPQLGVEVARYLPAATMQRGQFVYEHQAGEVHEEQTILEEHDGQLPPEEFVYEEVVVEVDPELDDTQEHILDEDEQDLDVTDTNGVI